MAVDEGKAPGIPGNGPGRVVADRLPVLENVRAAYSQRGGDVALAILLSRFPRADDELLTEIIEADGTCRLELGRPIQLRRYLDAVPDLALRAMPLDAAIDFTMRAMSQDTQICEDAVESLVRQHPELEVMIREAALLDDALHTTESVEALVTGRPRAELPRGFGPSLPSGRPRYLLRELVGTGSHGAVYQAVDRQLSEAGRPALVAIKVLAGDTTTPAARRRLIEEASKARRVNHPNVVSVLDRGTARSGEDYVVFEYVEGGTLAAWLNGPGRGAAPRRVAGIVAKIARGVQAAHAAGLVHCDLKPGNIILTADEEPKVSDFGVAVRDGQRIVPAGEGAGDVRPIGNLAFISPEQYRMEDGALAPPSDIYALGGILYYMLTGLLPNGQSAAEVAAAHHPIGGRDGAPSPRAARPDIDADLDAICRRALCPTRAERYSSAESLAADLEAWARCEPINWNRPSAFRRLRLFAVRLPVVVVFIIAVVVFTLTMGGIIGYLIGVNQRGPELRPYPQAPAENTDRPSPAD